MSIINASSGYHNLKLERKVIVPNNISCPFGRYRYKQLPFGAVLVGNMFQSKIDDIFSDTDDILAICYDNKCTDHNVTVHKVLQRYKEVNLKLNKDKCNFKCTSIPFFGEVISRRGVQPDP